MSERTAADQTRRDPGFDAVDLKIVVLLQEDGRRSYRDIGRRVGLSEAAARKRVNRMRASGMLQIVAVTDPLRMRLQSMAMVAVQVDGDVRAVARALSDLDAVEYVVITIGSVDLLAEVLCHDQDELFDLVSDTIRSIPGVRRTETFMYLGIEKQVFSWGRREQLIDPQPNEHIPGDPLRADRD